MNYCTLKIILFFKYKSLSTNQLYEAARKLKEIGKEEVDLHRISITFTCSGLQET